MKKNAWRLHTPPYIFFCTVFGIIFFFTYLLSWADQRELLFIKRLKNFRWLNVFLAKNSAMWEPLLLVDVVNMISQGFSLILIMVCPTNEFFHILFIFFSLINIAGIWSGKLLDIFFISRLIIGNNFLPKVIYFSDLFLCLTVKIFVFFL